MRLVGCLVSSSLLMLSAACATAAPQQSNQVSDPPATKSSDATRRNALTLLLREAGGQQRGSGVLVSAATRGLWVVSNRHVVGDMRTVCVVMADRSARAGLVVEQRQRPKLDLALIWLPSAQREAVLVAEVNEQVPAADALPLVVATGFPTSTTSSGTS